MTREAKDRFKFCFRQFVFHYSTFSLREPSVDDSPRSASTNVVERAVGVDAWHRRLNGVVGLEALRRDRKSTRLNSSHLGISYAVFCLKKKNPLLSPICGEREPR